MFTCVYAPCLSVTLGGGGFLLASFTVSWTTATCLVFQCRKPAQFQLTKEKHLRNSRNCTIGGNQLKKKTFELSGDNCTKSVQLANFGVKTYECCTQDSVCVFLWDRLFQGWTPPHLGQIPPPQKNTRVGPPAPHLGQTPTRLDLPTRHPYGLCSARSLLLICILVSGVRLKS